MYDAKKVLIEKLLLLKEAEEQAKNARLQCESDILKEFFNNDHLEEISKQQVLFEATRSIESNINNKDYVLKIKYSINRKVDQNELSKIYSKIPEAIRDRLIRLKPEINITEYKFLLRNEPAIYNLVSSAVIETAAKPYLTIEEK